MTELYNLSYLLLYKHLVFFYEILGSVSSVASSAMGGPVKLGDRVIVSSQTAGTKTGTLRFLGPTDFAAGDWAGVELDAPIGKNDGCVGDKRYFECKPKFGLFAPLHKVSDEV